MELTTLTLCADQPFQENDAPLLRGYFGRRYQNRPEFHHHGTNGLIYQHPLIQYKTIGGVGRIMGLEAGSFLIQALPEIERLTLNGQNTDIIEQNRKIETVPFGPTQEPIKYRFMTPWLALNQENHQRYMQTKRSTEKTDLLNRILIGNLISLCKSVHITIEERLKAHVTVTSTQSIDLKPGIALIGLTGTFAVNFQLPLLWGIGKQSARGFGSVRQIKE